jgi:phospholipase/carboxylesterase
MRIFARRGGRLVRAQRVAEGGASLARAKAAVIMLHGRGASAQDMLALADALAQPDLAYLAPQAAGHSWYPYPFTAPISRNEPWLSSALRALDRLLDRLGDGVFPSERVWCFWASPRGLAWRWSMRPVTAAGMAA